ncbi:hypothetical protein [Haloprofundus salinisoli]|uniref:hypothetical protein n=1 Tax=Haloprofundus salinisoli TaxID=2876193 RepID=UPI001CCF2B50|nr:hypothetical protein [Haloprofundus salinisoli]
MVRSRTLTALLGLVGSLLISALLWWYFDSFVFFLFLPFVPFLFRGTTAARTTRRCPTCGFRTEDENYEYCPRDGTRLE